MQVVCGQNRLVLGPECKCAQTDKDSFFTVECPPKDHLPKPDALPNSASISKSRLYFAIRSLRQAQGDYKNIQMEAVDGWIEVVDQSESAAELPLY